MGRLFWKIFLSFWLALILVVLGSNWGTALYFDNMDDSERFNHRQRIINNTLDVMSSQLQYEGLAALQRTLHPRRPPPALFELTLIDSQQQVVMQKKRRRKSPPKHHLQTITRDISTQNGQSYQLIATFVARKNRTPLDSFLRPLQRFPMLAVLWFGMALLLSGLVCFWLAWYLTKPIRQLQQASQRLAMGDLNTRVVPQMGTRRDEMTALGADFDNMAERLQILLSSQKQLLSDISHELRSPLARLQLAVALTRKKTDQSVAVELERIEREVVRMGDLVGQVLTLSRLETGNTYQREDYVDIALLLEDIVQDAEFEAQSKQCHVELQQQQTWTLKANAELLQRALENIIRNAIRYTAKQSRVTVHLVADKQKANHLSITICDQGSGIADDQLQRIFEPFVRISESRQRKSGGYGLGLAIAERAVHLHHGTIHAFNQTQGGLCIKVTLPVSH